jgi:hypothetical protein
MRRRFANTAETGKGRNLWWGTPIDVGGGCSRAEHSSGIKI